MGLISRVSSRTYRDESLQNTKKSVMFGLYSLAGAAIFFCNAICILHEERFLSKWGLAHKANHQAGFGDDRTSIKDKLIHFITSVRTVMKYPLIGINIVTIVILTLFG